MMNLLATPANGDVMFYVLMGVLIAFIVLLIVLAILLIVQIAGGKPVQEQRLVVQEVVPAPVQELFADELGEQEPVEAEPDFLQVIELPAAEEAAEAIPEQEVQPEETEPAQEEVEHKHIVKELDDEESESIIVEGRDRVRYDKSFTAKLIQLDDTSKEWYSKLKNYILSFDKARSRMSWKRESFRVGRATVVRFSIRGKTLCVQLALDPAKYTESKYKVEDISDVSSSADTPCLYRIKNLRRKLYCKELIDEVMENAGAKKFDRPMENYYLPYDGTVGLMQRGLIKRVVTTETTVYRVEDVNGVTVATPVDADAVIAAGDAAVVAAEAEEEKVPTVSEEVAAVLSSEEKSGGGAF